jgi:hypothetical protein
MFYKATVFNYDIGNWDTAMATSMASMFVKAFDFNQDIGSWNTSAVTNVAYMFNNANAFDQNLGNWSNASLLYSANMMDNTNLTCPNFKSLFCAWHTDPAHLAPTYPNTTCGTLVNCAD